MSREWVDGLLFKCTYCGRTYVEGWKIKAYVYWNMSSKIDFIRGEWRGANERAHNSEYGFKWKRGSKLSLDPDGKCWLRVM